MLPKDPLPIPQGQETDERRRHRLRTQLLALTLPCIDQLVDTRLIQKADDLFDLAIPQLAPTRTSLPQEIDTGDTHFSDLTCPRECLRVPFSTLPPETVSNASRWKGTYLSVIASVHAGWRERRQVESLPLLQSFKFCYLPYVTTN